MKEETKEEIETTKTTGKEVTSEITAKEVTSETTGTSLADNVDVVATDTVAVKDEPRPVGRPTGYSKELADRICEQLAEGISLRTVCLADDMPSKATVFNWMRTNKEFLDQYARAKEESADALFEETIDIADESLDGAYGADPKSSGAVVQAYRLRVDTRKWYMSKMKPKKYGEKVDVTSGGEAIKGNNIIIGDFKDATNNK